MRHGKVSIGFSGGIVLSGRATVEALGGLHEALAKGPGWHELALEDGTVSLDLAQVAYVRVESDEPRVGFGA